MAFTFDATDYLTITDHADLTIPAGDWTFCGSFKVPATVATGSDFPRMYQHGTATAGTPRIIIFYVEDNAGFANDNHFCALVDDGTTSIGVVYVDGKNLSTLIGKWVFWCVTYDYSAKTLYVRILDRDNHVYYTKSGSAGTAFTAINPAVDATIGQGPGATNKFVGDMGNVAFIPGVFFDNENWHGFIHGQHPHRYPGEGWYVPMIGNRTTEIIGTGAYNLSMSASGAGVTEAADSPQMSRFMPPTFLSADDAEEVESAPTTYRPLIISNGKIRQMRNGETLDATIINADEIVVSGFEVPVPTAAEQVLLSDGAGSAAWSTATANTVLIGNGAGEAGWSPQPDSWGITSLQIANWDIAYGWGDHAGLYDATGTAAATVASHESTYNHANYDTAYSWGDHAGLYDAVGTGAAAVATHESTYNHANYDTAYGWGNHAGLYDTTGTAAAAVSAHETTYNHAQFQTAYSWGNHAGLYDTVGTASSLVSAHESTYDHTGFFFALAGPTADNQVLQATGSGAASWTTDVQTLTSLQVDNLLIDNNSITNSSNTIYLTPTSTNGYGVYHNVNTSLAGRCYGFWGNYSMSPAVGDQARGRQTVVAASCAGALGWVIGEYMQLNAIAGGGSSGSNAAYYIPEIQTGGNEWAIYCFNNIKVAYDNRGIQLGTGTDAHIYYDATDLVIDPQVVGSGSTHFLGSNTTLDSGYKHVMAQHWIGEVSANRLELVSDRSGGGGGIFDFKYEGATMDGGNYNAIYVWANSTPESRFLKFGYEVTGTDGYRFNSYAATASNAYPIMFDLNTVTYVALSYINGSEAKWKYSYGTQKVTDKGVAEKIEVSESHYIGGTSTGTIKIRFGWALSNVMSHVVIKGYNYNTNPGPWEVRFGGYDVGGGSPYWHNQSCQIFGNPPFQSVRCAIDSGYPCILLGDTSTSWSYVWMYIDSISASDAYGASDVEGAVAYTWSQATSEAGWGLTGVEAVPCYPMPGCEIEDNGDGTINFLVNSLSITNPQTGNTPAITGADVTIYVATTGSDTTGNGTSGSPYASVGRAMLDVKKMVPSGDDADTDYTITISLAAGHYTVSSAIRPMYAYGNALFIEGSIQDCNSSSATSYGSDTALSSGLSYINVSGILAAGTTASVGDYLVVKSATGGTNPHLVEGCHEITAWTPATRAYTAKVIRRSGVSAVPSGTITLTTAHVSKTTLSFATGNGIYISGGHGGTWDKMTLVGNTSGTGVWSINAGFIFLNDYFSTSCWSENLYAQNNSTIFADGTVHSYSNGALVKLQNSSIINLRYGAVISGARTYGVQCFIGATISAFQLRASTAGGTQVLKCYHGAFIEATSSILKDPYSSAEYADATLGGGVDITGATVAGGTTSTSASNGYVIGP